MYVSSISRINIWITINYLQISNKSNRYKKKNRLLSLKKVTPIFIFLITCPCVYHQSMLLSKFAPMPRATSARQTAIHLCTHHFIYLMYSKRCLWSHEKVWLHYPYFFKALDVQIQWLFLWDLLNMFDKLFCNIKLKS